MTPEEYRKFMFSEDEEGGDEAGDGATNSSEATITSRVLGPKGQVWLNPSWLDEGQSDGRLWRLTANGHGWWSFEVCYLPDEGETCRQARAIVMPMIRKMFGFKADQFEIRICTDRLRRDVEMWDTRQSVAVKSNVCVFQPIFHKVLPFCNHHSGVVSVHECVGKHVTLPERFKGTLANPYPPRQGLLTLKSIPRDTEK